MLDTPDRILGTVLSPGETLLWSGKPRGGLLFRKTDVFLIPGSLMFCAFAVFWEYSVGSSDAPLMFDLWGIPFVIVGAYMLVGRFAYDAALRAKTTYGLTEQRAIIVKQLFSNSVQSVSMRSWVDFDFSPSADGSGTITFGTPPGMFGGSRYGPPPPPAFEAIADAARVYTLVRDAQTKAQAN